MSSLLVSLSNLRVEVGRNTRLRVGLWLIAAIVLFYLILLQSDRLAEVTQEYVQTAMRLGKAEGLLAQKDWVSLRDTQNNITTELSQYLWEADTLGLAQASLQGALNEMIADLNMRNPRLSPGIAQQWSENSDIWQIQIQFNGRYKKGDELNLLYKIARYPRKMVVDRLDLDTRNTRIIMIVSAYFVGLDKEAEE